MSNSEFTPSRDGIDFFVETGRKYTEDSMSKGEIPSPIDHFKFLCDRMLASGDANIKVAMSRVMMYMGFQKLLRIVSKGIIEVMNNPMTSMMKP